MGLHTMLKALLKTTLAIVSIALSFSVNAVQVDLLLLYDDFTANRYNGNPQAAMQSWVDNSNAAYQASQVDIQLRLVGLERYNPSATNISAQLTEIRNSSRVGQLRNQHGADFVALIASRDGNICGIGNFAVRASAAFNVTGVQCGYLTLIHELGHNMGLAHSRRQGNDSGARYRYGIGYGVDNSFSTVMAYPQSFGTRNRLNRFSDPNRDCQGVRCGVPIGQSQEADAHTALNNVRNDIANFRNATNGGGGNPNPTPAPSLPAPSNLNANATSSSEIQLSWADNSTGEDEFEIQRSTQNNSGFSRVGGVGRGVTSFADSGLQANTTYFYRVRARLNSGTNSNWSNVSAATTSGSGNGGGTDPNTGLDLAQLGFSEYSSQIGNDASATIQNNNRTLVLQNNVWVASSQTFNINSNTVLRFNYSSNSSGEIHGIGFDTDNTPTTTTIFQLAGSQNWGLTNYSYTGNGSTQSFEIPVGSFFTGDNFRLILVNDNDAGSGNVGTFSNIEIINAGTGGGNQPPAATPNPTPTPTQNPTPNPGNVAFGLEFVDNNTATLFHVDGGHSGSWNFLCINSNCQTATKTNGRYERTVSATPGNSYLLEFKVQDDQSGQCITTASVDYSNNGGGTDNSSCR